MNGDFVRPVSREARKDEGLAKAAMIKANHSQRTQTKYPNSRKVPGCTAENMN
ncbi:MAG: hypothetical protein ACFCU6_12890 [Balneolaceae bacterium]